MKKISTLVFLLLILVSTILVPHTVIASTPVSVSVSKSEVMPGEPVTITVGSNVSLSTLTCIITYDSSKMEFSTSSTMFNKLQEGQLKAVFLTIGGVDVTGSLFTLEFRAKNIDGTAQFKVTPTDAANIAGERVSVGESSSSIRVKGETVTTTVATTASTTQAPVTTKPASTAATTTTTTTTTEETTTGTTRPLKAVDHNGRSLSIVDLSFEELDIPSGYVTEERIINGSKLRGYYSDGEDLFLAVLAPSDGEPNFYFYDSVSKSFIPYLRFTLNEEYYHVTYMPESQIPFGTTRKNAEIKGIDLPVLEFNSGEYILLDEYMKQYQERLAENEADNIDAGQTGGIFPDKLIPIDAEVGSKNSGSYLLALQGKDKEIERFFYNESLDQLLHYDFMLMPAFGTFLDKNFNDLMPENTEGPALQTEVETAPVTDPTVPASSEQTESLLGGTVNLFSRNFKLWQIIAAAALLLFIIVLVIVMIVKAAARRGRAEYPFSEDFLADDPKQISENAHSYVEDDLDAENFRSIDYDYPDDFPEVSDISDIDLEEGYFGEDYQANKYSERSEQEDQEEI